MAKKKNNGDKFDAKHKRNVKMYELQIDKIYNEAIREAVALSGTLGDIDPDKAFTFDDYPVTRKRVDNLMTGLKSNVEAVVLNGIKSEWTLANNKNNVLCDFVFGKNKGKLTQEQYRRYYSTNDDARIAFEQRKTNGLNLSDRVWNYTKQFKEEIEMGLDLGIRSGRSAEDMSRDIRQYLRKPNELFRRVRDEHGQLHLSKRAAAYHPGQGVYRSSYKNARRLTATETNMAYATSDYERWQQLDFVVGIEVKLSGNHTCLGGDGKPHEFKDICDELAGKYPKTFKFTGWHPQCRCIAISILKTQEEMDADTHRILNGEPIDGDSVNTVEDVPQAFKDWCAENSDRIDRAAERGTLPYFLRDNRGYMDKALSQPKQPTALERAAARHAARTPEQQRLTLERWQNRQATKLNNYIVQGYLPNECNKAIDEIRENIAKGNFDESNKIITRLQKAAQRHISRTADEIRNIQDLADIRIYGKDYVDNIHKIEQELNIKRGKRMTHDEANLGKVNPNYSKHKGYQINCSTCSGVYYLRRLGFDVEANPKDVLNPLVKKLSEGMDTWNKWKDNNYTSILKWQTQKGYKRMTKKRYENFISENTKEAGIYELNLGWKGSGGHSTLLEVDDKGNVKLIDQQNHKTAHTLNSYLGCAAATVWVGRGIKRIDNAEFNYIWAKIAKAAKTKRK